MQGLDYIRYVFVTNAGDNSDGKISDKLIEMKSWVKLVLMCYGYIPIREARGSDYENMNFEERARIVHDTNIKRVKNADLLVTFLEEPSMKTGYLLEHGVFNPENEETGRVPIVCLIPKCLKKNYSPGMPYIVKWENSAKLSRTNNGANLSLMLDGIVDKYLDYEDSENREEVIKNVVKAVADYLNSTGRKRIDDIVSDEATKRAVEGILNTDFARKAEHKETLEKALMELAQGERKVHKSTDQTDHTERRKNYVKKLQSAKNIRAFIIGSITNVKPEHFSEHLDFKMAIVNLLRFRFEIVASFALLDNEWDLCNLSEQQKARACYLIDQYSVEKSDLIIALFGKSIGTGLELGRANIKGIPVVALIPEGFDASHQIMGMPNMIATINYEISMLEKALRELAKTISSILPERDIEKNPLSREKRMLLQRIYNIPRTISTAELENRFENSVPRIPPSAEITIIERNGKIAIRKLSGIDSSKIAKDVRAFRRDIQRH